MISTRRTDSDPLQIMQKNSLKFLFDSWKSKTFSTSRFICIPTKVKLDDIYHNISKQGCFKKKKKKVNFLETAYVRFIENVSEYSYEEKYLTWYTREEIKLLKQNATARIRGVPQTTIDKNERGLEHCHSEKTYRNHIYCKRSHVRGILKIQDKISHMHMISYKDRKHINKLKLISDICLIKAQRKAKKDAMEAMQILGNSEVL
mmetsp:Transcript_1766/g.2536  ORF Transcript_1766/g.2536 Transcript_1766/m.2536 type:complete len:204 (-) Transcript_1766:47-658(-)